MLFGQPYLLEEEEPKVVVSAADVRAPVVGWGCLRAVTQLEPGLVQEREALVGIGTGAVGE
jgi:hypothetical protein